MKDVRSLTDKTGCFKDLLFNTWTKLLSHTPGVQDAHIIPIKELQFWEGPFFPPGKLSKCAFRMKSECFFLLYIEKPNWVCAEQTKSPDEMSRGLQICPNSSVLSIPRTFWKVSVTFLCRAFTKRPQIKCHTKYLGCQEQDYSRSVKPWSSF